MARSGRLARNNYRKVTPGFTSVTTVGKKPALIGVRTSSDVVDRVIRNPRAVKLDANQRGEIAVRLGFGAIDDFVATRSAFHFGGNLLSDLERSDSDMRADRYGELTWVVPEGLNRRWNDPRNRTAPTRMRGCNVTASWVGDQHRHAVGRTHRNAISSKANDEPVAFGVDNRFGAIVLGNLTHPLSVNLSLLKKATAGKREGSRKACAVLADGGVVVPEVKTKVERVVRCSTYATRARCKPVTESIPIQKGRMQSTHIVFYTMTTLRGLHVQAKGRLRDQTWR